MKLREENKIKLQNFKTNIAATPRSPKHPRWKSARY